MSPVHGIFQARILYPARLLCPWDFPGKNTGVGCLFLFQGSFLTQGTNPCPLCLLQLLLLLSHFSRVWLCNPIDGSPEGSPVPGILQARTLEWIAIERFFNLELCGKPTPTAWVQIMALLLSRYDLSQAAYLFKILLSSSMKWKFRWHLSSRVVMKIQCLYLFVSSLDYNLLEWKGSCLGHMQNLM